MHACMHACMSQSPKDEPDMFNSPKLKAHGSNVAESLTINNMAITINKQNGNRINTRY